MSFLTPLEPPHPSLYYIQVILSPKRVSSCKGVNPRTDLDKTKTAMIPDEKPHGLGVQRKS